MLFAEQPRHYLPRSYSSLHVTRHWWLAREKWLTLGAVDLPGFVRRDVRLRCYQIIVDAISDLLNLEERNCPPSQYGQNAQVGGGVSMDGLRNNVQVSLFTGVLLSVEFIRSFTFTSLISLVRPPKLKYI